MTSEVSDSYHMLDSQGNSIEFTESQKKCIRYNGESVLVIKGTAGSGKSMMVIKRAIQCANKTPSNQRIAIFTYNKSLANRISSILQINGIDISEGRINSYSIDNYLATICKRLGLIPSSNMGLKKVYRKSGRYSQFDEYQQVTDDERVMIISEILSELSFNDPHQYYNIEPAFWAEEIQWMYQNGLVDDDDKDIYLNMSREGRCKNYAVRLSKEGRERAFKIFIAYNNKLMNKKKFEWDRLYSILYRDHLGSLDASMKFDYILIDEAQDMTLTKMKLLKELCTHKLCVAMDKNQSLYGHRWSFQRDLGFRPSVKTLEINHRGTRQIDLLSQDLKKSDDSLLEEEDIYPNEISPKEGPKPCIIRCNSPNSEIEFIVRLAEKLSQKSGNTAILCPNYKNLRVFQDKISHIIPDIQFFRDGEFSSLTPGVKLITIYSSKGLGFTNVILPNFEKGVFPKSPETVINSINRYHNSSSNVIDINDAIAEETANSRRLAYVGITRALARLYITYSGEPSPFLREFNPDHYDLLDERFKPTTDPRIGSAQTSRPRNIIESNILPQNARNQDLKKQSKNENTESKNITEDPAIILGSRFEVIDKRKSGGALWVIDAPDISGAIEQLNAMGFAFEYASNGSRSTGHRPAYYMRE